MKKAVLRYCSVLLVVAIVLPYIPARAFSFPDSWFNTASIDVGDVIPSYFDSTENREERKGSFTDAQNYINPQSLSDTADYLPRFMLGEILHSLNVDDLNEMLCDFIVDVLAQYGTDVDVVTSHASAIVNSLRKHVDYLSESELDTIEHISRINRSLFHTIALGETAADIISKCYELLHNDATLSEIEVAIGNNALSSYINGLTSQKDAEHANIAPMNASAYSFGDVRSIQDKLLSAPYSPADNVKEQVNLASGELEYSTTDVVLPGVNGLDLVIGRAYRSLDANYYTPSVYLQNKSDKRSVFGVYKATNYSVVRGEDGSYDIVSKNESNNKKLNYTLSEITKRYSSPCLFKESNGIAGERYDFSGGFSTDPFPGSGIDIGISSLLVVQETYPQTVNEYIWNMGTGWSLNFSHLLLDQDSGNSGQTGKMRVCLSDGRQFVIARNATNGLGEYFYEDVKLVEMTGAMNGQNVKYRIEYAGGKIEYFNPDGCLLRIADRYGNKINFEYFFFSDYSKRKIAITDSMGNLTTISNQATSTGINKIVKLPDGKQITYVLTRKTNMEIQLSLFGINEYNLSEYIDLDGESTYYNYDNMAAPFDFGSKLKGVLDSGFYSLNPNYTRYGLVYSTVYYRQNYYANLSKVIYPTGAQSNYTYYLRWNDWLDTGIYQDYAIESRYSVQNGVRYDEKQYFYSNQYVDNNGVLTRDIYNIERYFHWGAPYGIGKATSEVDFARNARTRYSFDPFDGHLMSVSYYENDNLIMDESNQYRMFNFYHPSITAKTITEYDTASSATQTTVEKYDYDQYGNVIAQWTALAEGDPENDEFKRSTCFDYTFNIPIETTYKRDGQTTVKTENVLSEDGKAVIETRVYNNDVLMAKSEYDYDIFGNLIESKDYVSIIPPKYIATEYEYTDGAFINRVTVNNIVDADGYNNGNVAHSATSDIYGRIINEVDGSENSTEYDYDSSGRVTEIRQPDNSTKGFAHNISANYVVATDELGEQLKYQYSPSGTLIGIYRIVASESILLKSYGYDNVSRVVSETVYTDGGNTTTNYKYDSRDRVIEKTIKDHEGTLLSQENVVYYADKTVKTVKGDVRSPSIVTVEYYDKFGRVIKAGAINNGVELLTTYTHNYVGDILTEKNARANQEGFAEMYTAKYEYDYRGNVVNVFDVYGNKATTEYDALGRAVSVVDAKSNAGGATYKTSYSYDNLGRLIKTETPFSPSFNSVAKNYYDANGNIIKTRQSNNLPGEALSFSTIEYEYNSRNMLTKVLSYDNDVVASKVSYEYDASGKTAAMVTANGTQRTEYVYDNAGNLITLTDALGQSESYEYDRVGNLISKTDRNGYTTQFTYDGLFRETERSVTSVNGTDTQQQGYTLSGLLSYVGNPVIRTDYSYDDLGRTIGTTASDGVTQQYTYNTSGNLLSSTVKVNGVQQKQTTYEYDKVDRLLRVFENGGLAATYGYDVNGNRANLTYANGVSTEYSYNRANLVTSLVNKRGLNILTQFSYAYYLDGNQSQKTNGSKITDYTYDDLGRLTSETETKNNILENSYIYTYDNAGNRATMTVSGAENYTTSYTYDRNNRLKTEVKAVSDKTDTTRYYYDPNGNTTATALETLSQGGNAPSGIKLGMFVPQVTLYRYDGFNRQVSVQNENGLTTYAYRPDGLRYSKTADGNTTTHVWDGGQIILELTNNAVTAKYIRGIGLIASQTAEGTQYYLYNGHGDVVQLVDANGNVTKAYDYDAFGNERGPDPSDSNPFRYCGEYLDLETNTYYLRARYYSPATGRFLTEDPARAGLNWYTYANNNPVTFIDPQGLDAIVCNQKEQIWGKGHMSAFVQDKDGNWFFFFFGDTVRLVAVEDSNILNSTESMNAWLREERSDLDPRAEDGATYHLNGGGSSGSSNSGSGGSSSGVSSTSEGPNYDYFCYIEGDFTASYEYYQGLLDDFHGRTKDGWAGIKNPVYNIFSNNCSTQTMEGLFLGSVTLSNGTQSTVKAQYMANNNNSSALSMVPNTNLERLQKAFGNTSFKKP